MAYEMPSCSIGAPQSTIGTSRFENVIRAELALVAWRWGRSYGGSQAMSMVAQCLANRHRKGWGTFLQIIERIPKFAATLEMPIGFPDTWDRAFLKLLTEIDSITDGTSKDTTNGSLYFGDLNNITNDWFLTEICRSGNHHRVADCAGTLVFWD